METRVHSHPAMYVLQVDGAFRLMCCSVLPPSRRRRSLLGYVQRHVQLSNSDLITSTPCLCIFSRANSWRAGDWQDRINLLAGYCVSVPALLLYWCTTDTRCLTYSSSVLRLTSSTWRGTFSTATGFAVRRHQCHTDVRCSPGLSLIIEFLFPISLATRSD